MSTKTNRNSFTDLTGPIEVWLSQTNMEVVGRVVNEDESTEDLNIDSLSLRGAEREITGWLLMVGFEPVGRWETGTIEVGYEETDLVPEVVRRFKPAKA